MPKVGEIYRHYRSKGGNDHTYEVIGIARNSETLETLVIYKPLYEESEKSWDHNETIQEFMSNVWAEYCARPLTMRDEEVVWDGKTVKRFIQI
jgi:hypothetical protein